MVDRARSFGSAAVAYERFRLGYPEELVDTVLAYAGRPVRAALEIGAGTGKATRVFASRGMAVTATDPDEAMLAELRRHVPDTVTTVRSTLEDLAPAAHDLVLAAASLHWTVPETRWQRIAALLGPDGVVASFGGPMRPADPELDAAVDAAAAPEVPGTHVASPDRTPPDAGMQWPGTELVGSPLFADVQQHRLERRFTLPADDVLAHLSTLSALLVLQPPVRHDVLSRVRRVLPEQVAMNADILLHLARRA